MKLKKIVIFSRHGLRYPLIYKKQFIENFGYDLTNWDFSDEDMGDLTEKGVLLEHKFGIDLQDKIEFKKIDYIFCNSMRRTYLTAKAIALGLTPYKTTKINTKIEDFSEMDTNFCLVLKATDIAKHEKAETIDKNLYPLYTRMEELLKVEKGSISSKKTTFYIDDTGFLHVRGALKLATDICDLFILKYYQGFKEEDIFESPNFIEDLKFMAKAKDVFLDCIFSDKLYQNYARANVYDNILKKELYSSNKLSLIVGHDSNLSLIFSKLGIDSYQTNEKSIEKYPVGAKLIFYIFEDNSYDLYYTYYDYETIRNFGNKKPIMEFLKRGKL